VVESMGLADYLGRFWYSSEPMFGVIMVVCFTSVLRAFPDASDQVVRTILISALFCCIAWGLVDGIFYAWEAHYELEKKKKLQVQAHKAQGDAKNARELVEDDLGDTIVDLMDEKDKEQIYQIIEKNVFGVDLGSVSIKEDILTVLIAFSLVVGSSIIVMLPFLWISPATAALKVSNIAGILLLFVMGFWREEDTRFTKKLITGGFTALIALIITLVTVYLGG
jgi:VIT1/CCC1 family predicted Fe2+/Mn2+ transporter